MPHLRTLERQREYLKENNETKNPKQDKALPKRMKARRAESEEERLKENHNALDSVARALGFPTDVGLMC